MNNDSYECEFNSTAEPGMIFLALTKNIDKWWTTSADDASVVGSKATFRFGDTYNTMLVKDIVEERKILWECVDQNHVDANVSIPNEWVGTQLIWEIAHSETGATVKFTHQGLTPSLECFSICNAGWNQFILDSLKSYLITGLGKPFAHEEYKA